MSFVYGGINTDDLEGVNVSAPVYPNLGGLTLDTVDTPGRDGRYYGGSRMTASVLSFRVTVRGENQQQADRRRLSLLQALDPSLGPRSLRLDNTENWHFPEAVVSEQIEWEKHIDRSKVIYDGTITFETNFDAAMRQIDPSSVTGSGRIEFIADMGSTVSYPTVIAESGGDLRIQINDFKLDLRDTPSDTYAVLNWDEFRFYTAQADPELSQVYRWEGDRHNSPSVFLSGNSVVARNLFPDPRATNLSPWRSSSGVVDFEAVPREGRFDWLPSFDTVARFRAGTEASGSQYVYRTIDAVPGRWYAIRSSIITPGRSNGRMQIQFRSGSSTLLSREETKNNPPSLGADYTYAIQAPADTEKLWVLIWPPANPPLTDWTYFTGIMVAEAATEQDALAQIETFFDGDTVGHIVPGERISSLVNHMEHYERPAIYPGQRVEVEVTPIGSNTATPVIIYPNHRRL